MTWVLIGGAIGTVATGISVWLWLRSRTAYAFIQRTTARLKDLNLLVYRLPDPAIRHLVREAGAIHAAKRDFDPRRLAMRFFIFYCTEYKPFDPRALSVEGAITKAIPTMRAWAKSDPRLTTAVDSEVNVLVKFLYAGFERSGMSKEEIIIAQMQLLAVATGREDHIIRNIGPTARNIAAGQ